MSKDLALVMSKDLTLAPVSSVDSVSSDGVTYSNFPVTLFF